jgi:peptidoglycan endopeptidase LytE
MSAFLLATALAVVPTPAAPVHAVAAGESLTWIAECELGDANRVTELIELNAELVSDPDIIQPGWELVLPEDASGDCPEEPPRAAPAARSSAKSQSPPITKSKSGGSSQVRAQSAAPSSAGSGLDGIRQCESGGDYGAVSSSGKYRGAYQFDRQTWQSVGGSGDPAAASPAEQDRRAQALYQQRGSSPWGSCN